MQLLEVPSAYRPGVTPQPRSLCMAKGETTTSEFATVNRLVPACGRKAHEAVITAEKADVTCPDCLAVLGGGPSTYQPVRDPAVTEALLATRYAQAPDDPGQWRCRKEAKPSEAVGGYRQLVDALNVEQLEARRADLEGELAAVNVLLDAARARERVANRGVAGESA